MPKTCHRCKESKELSDFYPDKASSQGVTSKCKPCHYAYSREWKLNNKDKARTHARNMKRKRKLLFIERLGGKCLDCGGVFPPCAFDFHHLDPGKKEYSAATSLNNSLKFIEKELDKCVLLCANCHRIRHSEEFGSAS